MQEHIDYVAKQIQSADRIPALMTAAFIGLELIERAATLLTELAPADAYPAYSEALAEATDAWWALSEAPSVAWPRGPHRSEPAEYREFTDKLTKLVLVVAEALLNAASKTTDPADRVACMKAAQHIGRVHTALR
ncbi:hypothetical protein [Spirillospora sp. NPDC047279]|uniref:hypothetical protein n=1 Tax=Spirillospora sp. NPDC047279 TaxID=3155478 RepID=UPI0033FEDA51